jgi:hypothetical protein
MPTELFSPLALRSGLVLGNRIAKAGGASGAMRPAVSGR